MAQMGRSDAKKIQPRLPLVLICIVGLCLLQVPMHRVATQLSNQILSQQNPPMSSSKASRSLSDTLLKVPSISVEMVWDQLLKEGVKQTKDGMVGVVMEVGVYRATQCIEAAETGFQTHCVEPSPISFPLIQEDVSKTSTDVQSRIYLYNVAAGPVSGLTVPFVVSGDTGDHVGDFDMWNMEPGAKEVHLAEYGNGKLVHVPTMRVDDIVANNLQNGETHVFLLKVDTQGFEPSVVDGLSDSLKDHKVKFLLMEFWPVGVDLIMNQPLGTCVAAHILEQLMNYGYTVYALPALGYGKAPEGAKEFIRTEPLPLQNSTIFCQFFYRIDQVSPSDDYKMGYWADVLAVAPNEHLPSALMQ
jgi:FkbM family methyltransferase